VHVLIAFNCLHVAAAAESATPVELITEACLLANVRFKEGFIAQPLHFVVDLPVNNLMSSFAESA
jgi:hypothetical protein